jgi:hypothetical protein
MTDTYLYLEYSGHGSDTLITKWRPNVTMERVQELLSVPRAEYVKYDYSPMNSTVANYWEGIMRIQAEKMAAAPIDVEDGTWTIATTELVEEHFDAGGRIETAVVNVVEIPIDKQAPQS